MGVNDNMNISLKMLIMSSLINSKLPFKCTSRNFKELGPGFILFSCVFYPALFYVNVSVNGQKLYNGHLC